MQGKEARSFVHPQLNLYVEDAEASAKFYSGWFGFRETFRTPGSGTAVHIELRLEDFTLGVASREAAKSMHGLDTGTGPAKGEIVLWTDDVDGAFDRLTAGGVEGISRPHDFIGTVRAAWLRDPDGNNIQIVRRLKN